MAIRTSMKTGLTGLALILSLGVMTGCSTISEIRDIVPKVDVDEEGSSVTLKGDDGESVTIETGTDGELPEWFPSELPLPRDYTVVNSTEFESAGEMRRGVTVTSPHSLDEFVASVDETLLDLGITPEVREVGDLGGMASALFEMPFDGGIWMINAAYFGEDGALTVSYAWGEE